MRLFYTTYNDGNPQSSHPAPRTPQLPTRNPQPAPMEQRSQNAPIFTDLQREVPQLEWVDGFSRLLDTKFRIPGTDIRFGVDFLLGLFPGAGDLISFGFSGVLVTTMARHGARARQRFPAARRHVAWHADQSKSQRLILKPSSRGNWCTLKLWMVREVRFHQHEETY